MSTRTLLLGASLLLSLMQGFAATNAPVSLFMPDGQMRSHLLRVYLHADIQSNDKPELTLLAGQFLKQKPPGWTQQPIAPAELARFQQWTERHNGIGVERTGTLLVFDLRGADFTLAPCTRVTPMLKWGEPRQIAISDRPVYIGNMFGAGLMAFLFVGVLTFVLVILASRTKNADGTTRGGWKRLLLNPEDRLSLSKTQAAFWTLCITGMLLCIGLTRLEVPAIPESLVALMGLSLATRAAIFVTEQNRESGGETPPKDLKDRPRLRDLIHSGREAKNPLAITKAQMLLWTCVAGFLFLLKSLFNGELWEVPWQLVTLMGISQASYVIPPMHGKFGGTNKEKEGERSAAQKA